MAPSERIGSLNALPSALSRSPGCCRPMSAMSARRISFVPSKIRLIRESRTACSYGIFLRVADAAGDLQRFVRRAKGELRREHLARRRLEREVDAAAIDHAGATITAESAA